MNEKKVYITAQQAKSLNWPVELIGQVDAIRATGEMPSPVYYLINKGQTGFHKIIYENREMMYDNYDEALKALNKLSADLRPITEVRMGLFVEGPAVLPQGQSQ